MTDIKTTTTERSNRYGGFEANANTTQKLMDVITDNPNYWDQWHPQHREAVHMIFHKVARMLCGDCMYEDNPHDIAGYAVLLEKYIAEVNHATD